MTDRGAVCSRFLLAGALCACPSAALAQAPTRLGAEFQVNTYSSATQIFVDVSTDSDGDFVMAWASYGQDGFSYGIFGQRFNSAGLPRGTEFQVNAATDHNQARPSLAVESNGDFVVVWESFGQDGNARGVFARRFDSGGAAKEGELQVNIYTNGYQERPAVASDSDGDFVVVWRSLGQDGSGQGVFARRFDSGGTPLGTEFQVSSSTVSAQDFPSVASESDGDFVVAWDGTGNVDIFTRRFSSAGLPLGAELRANTHTVGNQTDSAVAVAGNGGFVIVWDSYTQDGSQDGIFARRLDAGGVPQGVELQVNTYTTGIQRDVAVAASGAGHFAVAWESHEQDGSSFGTFARFFDSSGTPQAAELQVNLFTTDAQGLPSVASGSNGGFIVAWSSGEQDGDASGIFAQRFAAAPLASLDVDGNGSLGALTDGLLILRHFFGFSGTTLTNAAVGANCSRCDSATIAPYISGLGSALDINDSGSVGALTDGLLIVRFLFGFTGTTLTNGAVGACGTRCDAATILPYLQTLD